MQPPRHPHWARRACRRLDPVDDHERVAHLLAEVRYGDPVLTSALLTVAFCRQMAVPCIAAVVHRGGNSPIMRATRKRNDDTMVFFGEMLRLGPSSAQGAATIDRMQAIHRRFPITAQQQVYTLASLAFELERIPALLGQDPFTAAEHEAMYRFWRAVAERMGIGEAVPPTRSAFRTWTAAYEREHWSPTTGGCAVADAMVGDFVARWSRPRSAALVRQLALALMEDELLDACGLERPKRSSRAAARVLAAAYFAARRALPDPGERTWSDHFGHAYGRPPHLPDLGYRPREAPPSG